MQRYGQIIGLTLDAISEYEPLHNAVWPEVLATIAVRNIRNYSIFRFEITLFAYFEYVGTDSAADMVNMAADPQTQAVRESGAWRVRMLEVFHVD